LRLLLELFRFREEPERLLELLDRFVEPRFAVEPRFVVDPRFVVELRFVVDPRFAVERFAVVRLAVDRFAVERFAVERFAVERFAVERFAVDRFAVERFAVDRFFALDPRFAEPAFDRERLPPARRRGAFPSSSPPSSLSPLSPPISFFAAPTAAGMATPSAAPATTFAGVDIPSSSELAMVHLLVHFASLNASMNLGTILSRRMSGPCCARYRPADSAASSAIGISTSAAASQLLDAAEARIEDAPERPPPFDPEPRS
jgi:hypothetical protein